jgi:hypothetical protein
MYWRAYVYVWLGRGCSRLAWSCSVDLDHAQAIVGAADFRAEGAPDAVQQLQAAGYNVWLDGSGIDAKYQQLNSAYTETGPLPRTHDRIVSMVSIRPVLVSWLHALRPGGHLITVLAGTTQAGAADKTDDG